MAMRRCRFVTRLVTAAGLVLAVMVPHATAAPKNVLILAEGPIMPYSVLHRQRIVEALRPDSAEPLNIFEEVLDSVRFQSADYERQLVGLYKSKYGDGKLSLVITVAEPALDFVLRHRDEIFPGVPLLFSAVDERALKGRKLGDMVTGLFSQMDVQKTVETALSLQPGIRRMLVVGGSSRFDRGLMDVARPVLRVFESRVAITYIIDKPLRDVATAVAALGDDSLVLFVSLQSDGEGVARTGPELIAALRRAATAPIYGMSKNFLGFGIVGGAVLDYERQGTDVGLRARRILDGVAPADIPMTAARNPLIFDWSELQRFSIPEARLPADATVVNRVPGVWEVHKRTILWVGTLLVGQFLLIAGLLVQHRRRRRAERAIRDLSGRLLTAQEEERHRIARELHDNVSQQIAMLAIRIDQVAATRADAPETMMPLMRDLRRRAVDISTEVHSLSHRLHSSKLEMLGLAEALRGHCQELLAQGIHARFHDEGLPPTLPKDVELCLFRIVQEALNNVVKHSGAREADVTLRAMGDVLELTVADRGRGFDQTGGSVQRGLGLASMRERLRLVDGQIEVRTEPGQGTTITARVPLPRAGSATADVAVVA